MKYLLFGGTQDTGKSSLIKKTTNYLLKDLGYSHVDIELPPYLQKHYYSFNKLEFLAVLQKGNTLVIVFTWCDSDYWINKLSQLIKHLESNGYEINTTITGIREVTDRLWNISKRQLKIRFEENPDIIEFPLGKVIRGKSLEWYHSKSFQIVKDYLIPALNL